MKRLTAILFLLLYATTALAITIDFHYCQGKMVKSSLLNVSEKPDCCCKEVASRPMPTDCCNDDVKVCKTDNHKTVKSITAGAPVGCDALTYFINYLVFANRVSRPTKHNILANPERDPEPVYLICGVFRI